MSDTLHAVAGPSAAGVARHWEWRRIRYYLLLAALFAAWVVAT